MRSLLVYLDAVNARDYSSMEAVFDDALEHRILPKSMARPVLTKKQYIDYWREIMGLFEEFEVSVLLFGLGIHPSLKVFQPSRFWAGPIPCSYSTSARFC